MQTRNLLMPFVLIFSVFLFSCSVPTELKNAVKFKKSKVFLKVESNGDGGEVLVIDSHDGPRCNNTKGCIRVNKGTIALIDFHLIASHDWYLTEMKICLGTTAPTPTNPCTLTKADTVQFLAGAAQISPRYNPDLGGLLDLTDLSNNLSKFNLLDLNLFPQDYYYMITACKGAVCLTADPPIENEGGGHNN